MSTRFYERAATAQPVQRTMGMFVAGIADIADIADIDAVAAPDLVAEATSWGMSARRAERIVGESIETLRSATDRVDAPIDELRSLVRSRLDRVVRSG